jgi:hypothetical protein
LEALLDMHIRAAGLPEPEREYRFAPPRRYRFDRVWKDRMLALEVDGGAWSGGRHTSGKGFTSDCEKATLAALKGWRVMHVTGEHIKSGQALRWLQEALAAEGDKA